MIDPATLPTSSPSGKIEGVTGGELLHGFPAELYHTSNPELKNFIASLCLRLNVHFRETGG
jgi:hypothetical protein